VQPTSGIAAFSGSFQHYCPLSEVARRARLTQGTKGSGHERLRRDQHGTDQGFAEDIVDNMGYMWAFLAAVLVLNLFVVEGDTASLLLWAVFLLRK
jgi:hypothetical protein